MTNKAFRNGLWCECVAESAAVGFYADCLRSGVDKINGHFAAGIHPDPDSMGAEAGREHMVGISLCLSDLGFPRGPATTE